MKKLSWYCECGTLTESEHSSDHTCYPEKSAKQIAKEWGLVHNLINDIDEDGRSVI